MISTVVAEHWHAYQWTGYESPPDSERRLPQNPYPPREIAHWLRKPQKLVVATYGADQVVDAMKWLEAELDAHPRGEGDLPARVQLDFSEDCLRRGSDVVWGYYSAADRYVSRALIACPRPDVPCPYRW